MRRMANEAAIEIVAKKYRIISVRTLASAAYYKRNELFDDASALNAFLHQCRTVIAGTHVTTWLEQYGSSLVRAHDAFFDLMDEATIIIKR